MSTAARRRSGGAVSLTRWLAIAAAALAMVVVLNGNLGSAGLMASMASNDSTAIDRASPDVPGSAVLPLRVSSARTTLAAPLVGVLVAAVIAAIGLLAAAVTDRRPLLRPAFAATAHRGRAPPR